MNTEREKITKYIILSDLSNLYPHYEQIISVDKIYNTNNLPDRPMPICSISKSFTGFLAANMAKDNANGIFSNESGVGTLNIPFVVVLERAKNILDGSKNLTDVQIQKLKDIGDILELVKKHSKRERLEKITMAQLLNHMSGISSTIFRKLKGIRANGVDGDRIDYGEFFSLLEMDEMWLTDNIYDYNNVAFSFAGQILGLLTNSKTIFEEIIKLIPAEKRPTVITTYFNDKEHTYQYKIDDVIADTFVWKDGERYYVDVCCGGLIMPIKQACDIFCYFIRQYTTDGRLKEIFEEAQNSKSRDFASYSLGVITYYNDEDSVDFYSHTGGSVEVFITIAVKPNGELMNCNIKIADPYGIILKCEIADRLNLDKLEDKQKEMIYKAIFDKYSNGKGKFDRERMHREVSNCKGRAVVVEEIAGAGLGICHSL